MIVASDRGSVPLPAGRPPLVVWSPAYEVDIGEHVFVTAKYRLARDRLIESAVLAAEDFVTPQPASWDDLGGVHTEEYLAKIRMGRFSPIDEARLETPFSDELRDAMLLSCGGTLLAARLALRDGVAVHLGGGFHHAFADHGEGFCLVNDVAVGIRSLLAESAVERATVVDLDVHHGNGTARLFEAEPRVFTFSMHQERNYPLPKPPSDRDVGLDDGTGDRSYLSSLDENLPRLLDGHGPDLVLYLAGADPYREDQLGGLRMSKEGLRARDARVLEACRARGVSVAVLMAGGYARNLDDTVAIHVASVKEAVRVAREPAGR